jgi:hypothetical protein
MQRRVPLLVAVVVAVLGAALGQSPLVNITAPTSGSVFYYGGQINLTFAVTPLYSLNTGFVIAELFLAGRTTACPLVRYPYVTFNASSCLAIRTSCAIICTFPWQCELS